MKLALLYSLGRECCKTCQLLSAIHIDTTTFNAVALHATL